MWAATTIALKDIPEAGIKAGQKIAAREAAVQTAPPQAAHPQKCAAFFYGSTVITVSLLSAFRSVATSSSTSRKKLSTAVLDMPAVTL